MSDVIFFMLVSVVTLWLQASTMTPLFPAEYKPDLFLVLVYWTSLRFPFIMGAGLTFFGGLMVDLLSGSAAGLFALIYCTVFVVCGSSSAIIHMDTPVARTITVFVAALFSGGIVALMRALTGPVDFGWETIQWLLWKSLVTGLAAIPLFPALEKIRSGYLSLIGVR